MSTSQSVDQPDKKPAVENKEMERMWIEAEEAFQKICGLSLQKGPMKSFDDVQKQIESAGKASYDTDDKDQKDTWAMAKALGMKSLKVLKFLVGILVKASDYIPIPSLAVDLGATALSFVFDIPEKVKGYKDAINQVFGEVASVLAQFRIYGSVEKINPELIRQIQLVMISFVKLCAYVVDYRQSSKWSHFLVHTKSILNDNAPLKSEKENLERLIQKQHEVEGTVTFATVAETLKKTEETLANVRELKHNAENTKTLTIIREALDVTETVVLDTNTTQTCTSIYKHCLEGTGSWIWTHEAYTAWEAPYKNGNNSSMRILIVSGPSSCGKTSASALITKRLEDQAGNRSYVAHYFFPTSTKRSEDDKSSVQSVLKYMAFQIARVDMVVLNTLGKACSTGVAAFRRSTNLDNLYKLWKELMSGASNTNAIYTFVFDGVENLPDKQAEMLLGFVSGLQSEAPTGHIRILVSGTDDVFANYTNSNGGGSALQIQIAKYNLPDMRIWIEDTLTKKGMHTKFGPVQQGVLEEILEKLPKKVSGSYSRLQVELHEIIQLLGTRKSMDELRKLLDTSTNGHETVISNQLQSLTTDEVQDLNELLRWVLFANYMLSLDELEAAMFLYSNTSSLVSLQYVIKKRYSAIFKVDGNHVTVQDGVREYLEKESTMRATRSSHTSDHPTISMAVTISNVDQEICADFLWDLTQKAIRDKFDFGLAANNSQATIAVGALEAHYAIAMQAFKYLSGAPHDQTKEIGKYFVASLPYHLGQLRSLENADKGALTSREKDNIGQNLYHLFKDEEMIRRHQEIFEQTWWSADGIEHLREWLADSSVTRKLNKKWRDEVLLVADPTTGFLKVFVKMVVEGFLRSRKWEPKNAYFGWIRGFMEFQSHQQPTMEDDTNTSSSNDDTLGNQVSDWCQKFLKLPDSALDSLWYERLGDAILGSGSGADAAILVYQRGIAKNTHSWPCRRGLGMAYIAKKRDREALVELELALQEAEREEAEPKPTKEDIAFLHFKAGKSAYKVDEMGTAEKHYLTALVGANEDQATVGRMGYLRLMLNSTDEKRTLKMLQREMKEKYGQAKMVALLKKVALEPDHMKFVGRLFIVASTDQTLLGDIVNAMEIATTTTTTTIPRDTTVDGDEAFAADEACGILLYYRGMAAYRYKVVPRDSSSIGSKVTDNVDVALKLWTASRKLLADLGGRNASQVRREATAALTQHYFQNMVDGNNIEHVFTLNQLVADENKHISYRGNAHADAVGLLGALYALRDQKAKAQDVLRPRLLQAIQILHDGNFDNDRIALAAIKDTMLRCRDFRNAAISIALEGVPDMVTNELCLNAADVDSSFENKQRILETAATLAQEIVTTVKTHVPDSSQQIQRIRMAKKLIDDAVSTAGRSSGTLKESAEVSVVRDIFQHRLSALLQRNMLEITPEVTAPGWFCDGNLPDGRSCGECARFEREPAVYRCFYCRNLEFCQDCLDRLRSSSHETGVETTCHPKHCWLRMPPLGVDMLVGPRATSVRVPAVKPVAGEDRVWEICYDDMDKAELISVGEWKEALIKEWDISMEDVRSNI